AGVDEQDAVEVALVDAAVEDVALRLGADDRRDVEVAQRDVLAGGLEGQQRRGAAALDLDQRARLDAQALGDALRAQRRDRARVARGDEVEALQRSSGQ